MYTKKNKILNNKTKKNKTFLVKTFKEGYPIYAAKSFKGEDILEYDIKQVKKYHNKCLSQVSGWFGDLTVAKSYKTKDNHIYKWRFKNETKLLDINKSNKLLIAKLFKLTEKKLTTTINLTKEQIKKIKIQHPYLTMTKNEKALYEFNFCFGFLSLEEQYNFMKLIDYLIENKFMDILMRNGNTILKKLLIKINYFKISSIFMKQNNNINRLSFYEFDKNAILNLCKLLNNNNYNISGVYQKNTKSFWFPDLILYKMNIKEIILFDPQYNLNYDKIIE